MATRKGTTLDSQMRARCPMKLIDASGNDIGCITVSSSEFLVASHFGFGDEHVDIIRHTSNMNEAIMFAACGQGFGIPAVEA